MLTPLVDSTTVEAETGPARSRRLSVRLDPGEIEMSLTTEPPPSSRAETLTAALWELGLEINTQVSNPGPA